MRILVVTDSYPPSTGGLERAVQALAQGLVRGGDDVHVVRLDGSGSERFIDEYGVVVHGVDGWCRHLLRFSQDPNHRFHPTAPDPALVRSLQVFVDRYRPHVVHAHGWIVFSCLLLRLPPGTALVHSLHDYGLTCAKKTLIRGQLLDSFCAGPALVRCLPCGRDTYGTGKGSALVLGLASSSTLLGRIDMFLPVSTAVGESISHVDSDRVRIIPSFVADDIADEGIDVLMPACVPSGPFVVFVGALGAHKGVDTLAQAHRRMRRSIPLVVIGPSPVQAGRETGSTARPVITAGGLTHSQIMSTLRAATVAVVPSRWAEPQGLVAIEAMAAGTPVVASDVGGLGEVVAAGAGLLVPPGDCVQLAAALDKVLDSPELQRDMSEAGQAVARLFTESEIVPRVRVAYIEARQNRRDRPKSSKHFLPQSVPN